MTTNEIPDGEMIKKYLALRATRQAIEAKHAEEIKPYSDAMELISNLMLGRLNERNAKNTATPEGTAYKSQVLKPKVIDRNKFIAFVIDQWDQWGDMMMVNAQVDAVKRFLEKYENDETPTPIPGVDIDYIVRCNIKRS
jgi:hypothetical protein